MKILLTNNALDARGGSESYLETIAWELRKLEHYVELFSPHCGALAQKLRGDGFRVHASVQTIPNDFDVIHGQHSNAIAPVRSILPTTPLVFASHSWFISIEDPLNELHADAFVAFNDKTFRRLRAHSATETKPIFRLTQPVTISLGDSARVPIQQSPKIAVAVSRAMRGVLAELESACFEHSIQLTVVGVGDSEISDARLKMLGSDIVFAIGRAALEGMAAGKAVCILDESSRAGWVTESSYPGLEADGFTGSATANKPLTISELIATYDEAFGMQARRLAVKHHAAQHHVADLVEIYRGLTLQPRVMKNYESLARLSAENVSLEARAVAAEWAASRAMIAMQSVYESRTWKLINRVKSVLRIDRNDN